jgi:hypothetical protein
VRLRIEGRGWFMAALLVVTIISVRRIFPISESVCVASCTRSRGRTSHRPSNLHSQGNEYEINFEDENGVHTHVFEKDDIQDANGTRRQIVPVRNGSSDHRDASTRHHA